MQAEPSERFRLLVERAANGPASALRGVSGPARLLSHIDADGISSASVLAWLLLELRIPFHASFIKRFPENPVKELGESYGLLIVSDMGSGYRERLSSAASRARVIVVDHHEPVGETPEGVEELNPHDLGIDGGQEVSAAGVAYALFRATLPEGPRPAHLALLGAIGDVQSRNGFSGVNEEILRQATEMDLVEARTELRLFGGPEYPLLLALERTVDPPIPGVSGSSSGALEILESLGIPPKTGDRMTTLSDLTEEQRRALLSEIVKRLAAWGQRASPDQLLGTVYTLLTEPPGSPLRDLGTFATVLNACGRMGRADVGLALGLGRRGRALEAANRVLSEYRRELAQFLDVLSEVQRVEGGVLFFDGRGRLRDTLTSPVASIAARSPPEEGVLLVAVAAEEPENPGRVKLSLRLTQEGRESGLDAGELASMAAKELGGEGGGHSAAAGLSIPASELQRLVTLLAESTRR